MPPLTPEQVALRSTFIGGSDAPSICGVNPYRTAHDVYLDKIGQGIPVIESEAMRWGILHEDTIAGEYARRTGREVYIRLSTVLHERILCMGCHVDRTQRDSHRITSGTGVLECKTTRRRLNKGECPEAYQIQLFHNMICTGSTWGTVVILIQGSELVWYDYVLDKKIEESIITLETRFWKAVQAKDWSLFGVE